MNCENEECKALDEVASTYIDMYNKLQKENEVLRECVEYYADEEHLNAGYPMELARQTLEELEK